MRWWLFCFELRVGCWARRQACRLRGHDWEIHGHEFPLIGSAAKGWPPIYVCARCGCEGRVEPGVKGYGVKITPV